jgi:anti-anti-sigma factor
MSVLLQSSSLSTPQEAKGAPVIEVGVLEGSGETIIRIAGKGCTAHADALATCLLGLSARRPSLVCLDLGGLTCISSLAMGVLVTFQRGVVRAGGRVRLAETLQESVRAALQRAGLLTLFGSPREGELATRS